MTYEIKSAESEGFEPPDPRRGQQISSLPRSSTLATFRGKDTLFFVGIMGVFEKICIFALPFAEVA